MDQDTEKRWIIAFILMFGVFLLWRAFLAPPAPPAPPAAKSHAVAKTAPEAQAAVQKSAPAKRAAPRRVALPVEQGKAAQDIVVENDLYRITFSTQGAVVKSWVLKKYQDREDKPLNVVNTRACAQLGYPMSLDMKDAALAGRLNSAVYVAQPSESVLQAPQELTFTYSDGKTRVEKQFSFGTGYQVKVKVSVFDGKQYLPVAVKWPGGAGDQSLLAKMRDKESRAFYDHGSGIKTVAQKKVDDQHTIPGPLAFAGLEDDFFAGVFLPQSPQTAVFQFSRHEWTASDEKSKEPPQSLTASLGTTQAEPLSFRLFVAPKVLDVLRAESPALEGLVNFGWFSVIAKPTFLGMLWIYNHVVHNWGWAIVILTVLINMAFFPLKLKSIRSAQAMQRVSPQMKEIQARYKQYKFNDPRRQRMNQEIMELYKKHGVNPLGGCLPMLVQLPIIYAFYEVLESSIAMRHAPWIFWIKDLSVPDPLYILPGVAIVLSFIMQKMTPMPSVDPAQQRMMMLAPLAVGFIFFYEAAGVTLYYFVYSAVAIAQQLLINRMTPPSKTPQVQPPSGGRTESEGPRKPILPRKPVPVKS